MITVASVLAQIVLSALLNPFAGDSRPLMRLLGIVAIITVAVLVYIGMVRLLERRAVSEFSVAHAPRELAIGILLGVLAITATVGLMWLFGTYRVTGTNSAMTLINALAIGMVPAFTEEIVFRGILHRIIEGSLGTWAALISTSLVFGASHLANPNASWFAAIAIAIEAGLMLGATYTLTRRLWLPIGMHFAWNWAQGGVYGVPVSGITVNGLLSSEVSGPTLLAGGGFGAEGTVLAIAVCLIIFLAAMVRVYRDNRLILPFWQRMRAAPTQAPAESAAA